MARSIVEFDTRGGNFSASLPMGSGASLAANQDTQKDQSFLEVMTKLIPGEVLAFYVPALSIIKAVKDVEEWVCWAAFACGLMLSAVFATSIQLYEIQTGEKEDPLRIKHIILSCIAFVLWASQLGQPFSDIEGYEPSWRIFLAVLTMAFTVAAPRFIKYKSQS